MKLQLKQKKKLTQEDLTQAELSEDLVASELIPEQGSEEQIFGQEEIQSMESEAPDWLNELAEDDSHTPGTSDTESVGSTPSPPSDQDNESGVNMMPDWLSDLAADEPAPTSQHQNLTLISVSGTESYKPKMPAATSLIG